MADLHKAIRATHGTVVHIVGDTKDNIKAYDSSESEVTLNWTNIEAWTDPNAYQISRKSEYPSVVDQLDDMYHNGFDAWKATIKAVKDKYPKG